MSTVDASGRMHPLHRLLSVAIVFLGVTFGSVAVQSEPASAVPSWYVANGCTGVPSFGVDAGVYFNFWGACWNHDYCYDDMWYGSDPYWGRLACDNRFLGDMQAWCNNTYRGSWLVYHRSVCNARAWVYYQGVRRLGGPFFNNPWLN